MGYRVRNVAGPAENNRDVAEFLAAFVCDGELDAPREGDDCANVWQRRMGWWWNENPFCRDDSPLGFILENDDGEIVGFNGLIPFDYVASGETVPTLVTTTFFVREAHRSAVMGMVSKQRALARDYQIIDGSPSPEMRRLLHKLGYQHSGERYQYFFQLKQLGGSVLQSVLRGFGLSFPLPADETHPGDYLATHPYEIEAIPQPVDPRLHRKVTRESLDWLCGVGSDERRFFGLCDRYGTLVSYAIGLFKSRCGVRACLLMDYADFSEDGDGLARLIRKISDENAAPDANLLTWSTLGEESRPDGSGLRRESILHYHLPKRWQDCEKACVPFEGDLPLL